MLKYPRVEGAVFAQGEPNSTSGLRPLVRLPLSEVHQLARKPKYMEHRELKNGIGFYYHVPSWAKKAGCPIKSEALGMDYGKAVGRAAEINDQLDAWREEWRAIRGAV